MRIGSSWSGTKKTEKRVHGAMTLNRKPRFINQHHMHFVGTKKKKIVIQSFLRSWNQVG